MKYETEPTAMCPVTTAVEPYVEVGRALGWDMKTGHLFSEILDIGKRDKEDPHKVVRPVSASYMTAESKKCAKSSRREHEFSIYKFV